jgi:uroporphyrin-3 C-methyltransferase
VTENKANTDGSTKSGAGLIVSFGMLISILALVVAGYAAYLIYESNSELKEARTSVRSLETELANLKRTSDQKIEQLSVVLEQTTASISQIREVENTAIADLGASFEVATEQLRTELRAELNEGLGTSGEDWLLAEVEYLIRLANQRVLMERDVSGALSLLSSADEIVEQTSGIAAYELRESLAYDIANLKAVSDLDTDGIFLSLSAMASQVTELRRKQPELSPPTQIQIDNGEAQNFYQQFLSLVNNIFGRVLNSVDYRRDGVAITPLLPPKEEYYLRQNLILKFEMAQLALLRNDQPIYHTSLSEAKLWIVKHFVETDPRTVALVTALDQLVEVEVDRSLPNISGSLRAVRGLLNTLHQQDSRGAGK